jgi:hypothetical protein
MLLWLSISKDVIPAKAGIHEQEFLSLSNVKLGCTSIQTISDFSSKTGTLYIRACSFYRRVVT